MQMQENRYGNTDGEMTQEGTRQEGSKGDSDDGLSYAHTREGTEQVGSHDPPKASKMDEFPNAI